MYLNQLVYHPLCVDNSNTFNYNIVIEVAILGVFEHLKYYCI